MDHVGSSDKNVMLSEKNAPTKSVMPNRPTEKHFGAVTQEAEGPKMTEQVVFNRLPKNYFMADAEE